jgi:dihydrofolate reductase
MDDGTITLYLAVSLDGHVADAEGGVEWLEAYESDPTDPEGPAVAYESFFESVDALVMGSTTYEQVLGFGEWPYGDRPTVVCTSRDLPRATDAVTFYDGDVADLAERLRGQYGHVWHVGGAALARAFLREGLVDDLQLTVVPVVLGAGIPLFDESVGTHSLALEETTTFSNGLVELRYRIVS